MKNLKLTYILAIFSVLFYTSCETTELEITSDPNFLSPEDANVDLFLNGVQEDFARFVQGFGDTGSELTRIDYMSGRNYADVYSPQSFNGLWRSAYQGMREDLRIMNNLAAESGQSFHVAIGQILEAYVMVTLVDFFGNVPYSESLGGSTNLNPNVDGGAEIYAAMHTQLNEAIQALGSPGPSPDNDFFYGGNAGKWIKAANTLKMKMFITVGDYANFNALAANPANYISENSDDFQFQWGTNEVQPDTRHPWYASSYTSTGGGRYMSNWLMNAMLNSPGGQDPRMYYYFYRQVDVVPGFGAAPDEEVLECGLQNPPLHYIQNNYVFCGLPAGYWGRDHGNDNGIPPDGFLRTLHGVYPAGGKVDYRISDEDEPSGAVNGDGNGGSGITPILLASWVDFMKAEAAWNGFGGDAAARDALVAGMTKASAKVTAYHNPANIAGNVENHRNGVLAAFDGAASADDKKNIVYEQYWIAMYGNGIDAYNTYRRTGFPKTLQANIEPQPGAFIRSLYYPANFVETNNVVDQKSNVEVKVFWDNNSVSLY